MKAQMSVEYLFVVALAMGMVLVTAYVFFAQSNQVSEEQQLTTVEIMGNDLLSVAKNVYYSGLLSKKTVQYTMPSVVNNLYVEDNALVFNVTADGSTYDLVYYSDVPIQGIFPETKIYTEQIAHILVYNREDYVLLCTEELGCD
jgi:hypothetical protein